jgi:ubiquitin-conjugating enzyme E2 M
MRPCNSQIWSLKKNEEAAAKKKPKTSAAQIRVQKGERSIHICGGLATRRVTLSLNKVRRSHPLLRSFFSTDLTELELPDTMKTHFPDPNNLLSFNLTITPDEGGLHWCLLLSSSSCIFSDPVFCS